jgi:GNAT superfamily N-acetyltransferase
MSAAVPTRQIAEIDGERVGCVFVVQSEKNASAAQRRCLLVEPKARGKGVGRRLVELRYGSRRADLDAVHVRVMRYEDAACGAS